MKKLILIAIALGVGILASFYFASSGDQKGKESLSARTSEKVEVESPKPYSEEPKPTNDVQTSPSNPSFDQADIREVAPMDSEDEIVTALAETNVMSSTELTHLIERLKASDHEFVAATLQKQMQQNDLNQTSQRNRVLLVADTWRSEALLPLWQDVALRTAESNLKDKELERTAMSAPEPTELTRGIELEIMTAIGNLGILGTQQLEARETLQKLISQPDPAIHTIFIRERAYYALKEADITASVVALKNLPTDDPLRDRLKRR